MQKTRANLTNPGQVPTGNTKVKLRPQRSSEEGQRNHRGGETDFGPIQGQRSATKREGSETKGDNLAERAVES